MVESVVLGRVVNYDHKDEEKKVIKNNFLTCFLILFYRILSIASA